MSRLPIETSAASFPEFADVFDDSCDLHDLIAVACNDTWSRRHCAPLDANRIDFE